MIIELLVDFAVSIFSGLLNLCDFLSIPFDLVNPLATICSYGSWVVGADILLIFSGCVGFWWTFKMTVGIVKFIWQLLPLT